MAEADVGKVNIPSSAVYMKNKQHDSSWQHEPRNTRFEGVENQSDAFRLVTDRCFVSKTYRNSGRMWEVVRMMMILSSSSSSWSRSPFTLLKQEIISSSWTVSTCWNCWPQISIGHWPNKLRCLVFLPSLCGTSEVLRWIPNDLLRSKAGHIMAQGYQKISQVQRTFMTSCWWKIHKIVNDTDSYLLKKKMMKKKSNMMIAIWH